ncbi:MAG: aminopeptidase N [Hyphomicrobium sp.]|nr:aminopeptidase N [Hyphomicrobium sp.]
MKTDTPRPIRLKDYRPPAYLIDKVDLDVALDPARTRVRSKLWLRPNPDYPAPRGPLRLDGEHLELKSVAIGKAKLGAGDYEQTETSLVIAQTPETPFTVETVVYINPEANTALQGLYRSRGVFCTQCEAEGFRRITFFLDRPDVLATYRVRIEADPKVAPVLLSNGNLVERGMTERGRRHYAVWHDPHPKPCYLFALVGGDLGRVASELTTMSGRKVDLGIYVEHGKEDRAHWAMDALKRSMRWDEVRFGREYDLDVFNIVAVSDFNMGAMENKGLNIFNDRLILASADTATDTMYEAIESVVAHEYFHNWTGNRITCRDWFQLCLKEGLTVYRDQEFSADERDRTVQRITDVRQLKTFQFPEDQGPLAHPVRPESYIEINNFYTPTVYEKGAELVRMIETILGRTDFRRGMDLYFARHDGEAATIEDFLKSFEDASGRDLSQFKRWYAQAGTPELAVSMAWDRASKRATLTFDQMQPPTPGQSKKQPLHIPVRLALIGQNGEPMDLVLADGSAVADGVVHVTERTQSFTFTGIGSRPVPSVLRGFSAPVRLNMDLADKDLELLAATDSDLFNRWQALNTYALKTLVEMVTALAAGRRPGRGTTFAKVLHRAVGDADLDPAYRAELLKLPTQSDVAREIGRDVDPDLIHKAHRQLTKTVGATLGDLLVDIYQGHAGRGAFSPSAKAAGKRALRNAALSLLVARGEEEDQKRLIEHFRKARSMTEEAHALVLLAASDHPDRDFALGRFHDRWKGDHLVIDTWFAAQAMSPRDDTLDVVRTLTTHPLFGRAAPNKVRALIGNFAMQNPLQFNRADGEGYKFVATEILEIDRLNPQISARMAGAFKSFRSLEAGRREKARRALQKVAKAPQISRDLMEMVTRLLDA